jgi:cytochrome c5
MFAADPVTLPEGEGKKILESACTSCHTLDLVTDKKWTRQEWQDDIQEMVDLGASLTKKQTDDLVDYLVKNFGPQDRAQELFEDVCSYCHSLARARDQHLSKQQWQDLIKGMIFEGPPVTTEEFSRLVDYLATNFGPEKEE